MSAGESGAGSAAGARPAAGAGAEAGRVSVAGSTVTVVLGIGLLLGIAANRLLWAGPVGPGLAIWMALLGGAAVGLARRQGWAWTRAVAGWSVVAVLAAAGTAWRASPVLQLLLLATAIVAASGAILAARGRRLGDARLADHVYALILTPWYAVTGSVSLLTRAELPERWGGRRAAALGRGVLLAIPPVLVFGALFASADPTFERAIGVIIPDLETLPQHVFLTGFFAWVSAGLLAGLFPAPTDNPLAGVRPPRLGVEEIATVLGLVAVLFLGFVLIQFSYLFGGASALQSISGLTVAEYARRGFFELLGVAGLVTVLLLVGDAATSDGPARRVFRPLAGALIALVMLVIASAALRLGLYVDAFGLTVARLFAAVAMAWVAVTLLVFTATTLRDRSHRFAGGALVAGVAAVAILLSMNPDALVARTNMARAADVGEAIDAVYLTELGADAAPALAAGLAELGPGARCEVAAALLRWGPDHAAGRETGDWRTWNAGLARAETAVGARLAEIEAAANGC